MAFEITKTFRLNIGHRTWKQDMRKGFGKEFYDPEIPFNKCANLHGHDICIAVTFESKKLDSQSYVIDTDLIKTPINKLINEIDHSFIADKKDPLFPDLKKIVEKGKLRLFAVDFAPSFEELSRFFFEKVKQILKDAGCAKRIKVKKVKIFSEGLTVQAEYQESK
ncbi:MAG: 6-carboxytetrahydropterin synthase [Candidatus ainarchaeum sp.]|nr:6-carboxytetrahydropterin synthase [Candidatus ainarchaeum sp.]